MDLFFFDKKQNKW